MKFLELLRGHSLLPEQPAILARVAMHLEFAPVESGKKNPVLPHHWRRHAAGRSHFPQLIRPRAKSGGRMSGLRNPGAIGTAELGPPRFGGERMSGGQQECG